MSKNLREILCYFGLYFDPSVIMIDDLQLKGVPPLSEPMTVVDPLNKLNNITKGAFRIKDIQTIFNSCYQFLISKELAFKSQGGAVEEEVISLLTVGHL